ncbi:MAG: hypothetical protein JNL74_04060, partial [Fibrobacteres bacterium]|nr:hypothetical protein [Fibrobacterota bacterium]
MRTIISMLLLCAANFAAITIPVEINNWSDVARTNEPVTAGIPLPKGTVYNLSDLRITDASGTTIPAQFKPLSKWWGEKLSGKKSESSIKWVLCDFQTTSTSKGSTPLFVKTDASTVTAPASPINLTETPQEITVITGPIKFTISKTRFNLFDALWINKNGNKLYEDNERLILPGNNNGGFITAGNWTEGECASDIVHKSFKAAPKRVVIEEQGLLKTVIRIEGRYYADSLGVTRGLYGWQCFITAYSGKSFVDVQWALTNDYLEGTKPKEKSAADAHTVYVWPFKSHSLSLNLNLDNASAQTYSLLADNELNGTASTNAATLLQKINSFSTNTGTSGTAAKGGVSLGDGSMGMRAVIRDFAQSSPKRLSVSKNKIDIEFLPDTSGSSPYSLDPFTRDNCRMRFEFFTGNASSGQLNNLYSTFETPLRMVASDRAWYRNTNAWERGFGIPFESTYNRKAPASWTRYTKPTNVNWQNYGQIGEFNGGGDHENLTTCFWKYLLTANPGDFESYESKVLWFNDRVQCHFGYDVWQKFSWFLDPLANMSQYRYCHEMFGTNAYPVIKSFTGYTLSADIAASHFPDDGHMTQLQQIEYYLLTGDLATKDAIENMGARAAGHIYGRVYLLPASYATYKWGSDSAKLDSNFTIPYGPR